MIDVALIREKPGWVKEQIAKLNDTAPVDEIVALDKRRREIIQEVEELRRQRNEASRMIGRWMGNLKQLEKELEQAEAGVEARRALVDVARSDYYPKIGVQATLSQSITLPERPNPDNAFVGDSFMGTGTRTGIGIQQNLNFGQTRAQVEQAEAELNAVEYQRTAAEQLVRFEVEEAYRSLLTAKAAVESEDRSTTIAGEWLRTGKVNFDLDRGDTEDRRKAVRAD
jgi:multidrug resistance efflux pump